MATKSFEMLVYPRTEGPGYNHYVTIEYAKFMGSADMDRVEWTSSLRIGKTHISLRDFLVGLNITAEDCVTALGHKR